MYKESFDVGKRITCLRMQKKYSVNKLANAAGISQSFLRDVELGNKNITVEYLSYICEALGITLADFFSDGFSERISNDVVIAKIYQLTEKQRIALLSFLDTMTE